MPTSGFKILPETNLGGLTGEGLLTITKTTDTFTSSCRSEIEDMLMDGGEGMYKHAAGFAPPTVSTSTVTQESGRTYVNMDSKSWQGGFTTVLTPSSVGPMMSSVGVSDGRGDVEKKVNRGGGRKPMKMEEEDLSPEEEERRKVRRERNKMAAARCRKRRMDQTSTLQEEVDQWEDKKRVLQEEIHALQNQREELQFILDAHKNVCRRSQFRSPSTILSQPKVVVKTEPEQFSNSIAEKHFEEEVHSTTTATTSIMGGKPSRPATLNLKSNMFRSIEGVSIDTPTNVILNFDSLMEGRTGLTPTNILTPVSIGLSAHQLHTPSLQTPTCSSQQRHRPDIGSPDTVSPKLVSL